MIRFDETISITIQILRKNLNLVPKLHEFILVRDLFGLLTVILPDHLLNKQEMNQLAEDLHQSLGVYSPGIRRIVLNHKELIDPEEILNSPYRVQLPDEAPYLIDRMLTNQEWLREPITDTLLFPTAAAFSIKGGVGRSTAVAAWAWGLARQGKHVLVVDLDLEAPGISSLLLDQLPKYGLVDWMVESLVQQADRALLDDILSISPLSRECEGTIQVVPSHGCETKDYIAKLGRLYLSSMNEQGEFQGLAHRLLALFKTIKDSLSPPDVVLIDARAGLHDIGAAVLSQLPTEVFLFARDDQQTWDAYQHLFKHLMQSRSVQWGMPDHDLRWRLKMVASQLAGGEQEFKNANSKSYQLWWTHFYDAPSPEINGTQAQSFLEEEDIAPHYLIPIYFESLLAKKSLLDKNHRPAWEVVERAFGTFITEATKRLYRLDENEQIEVYA